MTNLFHFINGAAAFNAGLKATFRRPFFSSFYEIPYIFSLKYLKSIRIYWVLIFLRNYLGIFLLCFILNIFLSLYFSNNVVHCMDEADIIVTNNNAITNNNNAVINPILDTPIVIETTPRNILKMLTNLGLSGATLYGGYYGLRSAAYINNIHYGGVGTKATLAFALFATGGFYGKGMNAISKKYGPFVNVNVGMPISTTNNRIPLTEDPSTINANCPLEVSELIFHPFADVNPLSDNPDLALLSVSILMIVLGIQCFNFILIRLVFIKFSSKILSYLKPYPFIYKIMDKFILILDKTRKLYVISFSILIYLNLIGALVFLLLLLNFLTHPS